VLRTLQYQVGAPNDDQLVLAGRTPVPAPASAPLLDFRCTAAQWPYLAEYSFLFAGIRARALTACSDTAGELLIDANVTADVGQSVPGVDLSANASFTLSVFFSTASSSTPLLQNVSVPLGSHGLALPVPFAQLPPANTTYNLTCVAAFASGASISTSAGLRRLPLNPYGGGATKLDRRTGALLRRAGGAGAWAPFLPWGFYTYYEDLAGNTSLVGAMAEDGCVARWVWCGAAEG
jgi:hypothetical protein